MLFFAIPDWKKIDKAGLQYIIEGAVCPDDVARVIELAGQLYTGQSIEQLATDAIMAYYEQLVEVINLGFD